MSKRSSESSESSNEAPLSKRSREISKESLMTITSSSEDSVFYNVSSVPATLYRQLQLEKEQLKKDLAKSRRTIDKFKTLYGLQRRVSLTDVLKVIKQVLINQVITIPLLFIGYYLMLLRGYDSGKSLPTLHRTMFYLAVCVLMNEVWFYTSHRFNANFGFWGIMDRLLDTDYKSRSKRAN